MRRSENRLETRDRYRASDAPDRRLVRAAKSLMVDVRVLGVISIAFFAPAALWNSAPAPVQSSPYQLTRGRIGEHTWSFALSPSGDQVATTDSTGRVMLRPWADDSLTERWLEFPGFAWTVTFSPDGRFLAAVGDGPGVCVWDLTSSNTQPADVVKVPIHCPNLLKFSPRGRYLAVTTAPEGTILVLDANTHRERRVLRHSSAVDDMAFSPDGQWLATAERKDPSMAVWNLETGVSQPLLGMGAARETVLAFSPDGALLASASLNDHDVHIWDCEKRKAARVLVGHTRATRSLAFSPDGSLLASAANDGTIAVWDVATGERRAILNTEATCPVAVIFSPDGRTLLLATGDDNDIRTWQSVWSFHNSQTLRPLRNIVK